MMSAARGRSTTPTGLAGGRRARTTRAARTSTQRGTGSSRRGRGGGGGGRIRANINQAPARKWAAVLRPPAAGLSFLIPTWVLVEQLTEDEREKHLIEQVKKEPTAKVPDQSSTPTAQVEGAYTSDFHAPMELQEAGTVQADIMLTPQTTTTMELQEAGTVQANIMLTPQTTTTATAATAADSSAVPPPAQAQGIETSEPPAKRVKLDTSNPDLVVEKVETKETVEVSAAPPPVVAAEPGNNGETNTVRFDISQTESSTKPQDEEETNI